MRFTWDKFRFSDTNTYVKTLNMETKHLFEDSYYLIGNKSVAKCFMFGDEGDCIKFKSRVDHHLSPLCDVLAYGFASDEFKLVVKLKSRKSIESYYKARYDYDPTSGDIIPETTYIFAQAMANLQSGHAKFFNFKYERDGGLMCRRYTRRLIESEEELDAIISAVNGMQFRGRRKSIWTFRRKGEGLDLEKVGNGVSWSSRACYEEAIESGMECFKLKNLIDLRGHFKILPPKELKFDSKHQKMQNLIQFILLKQK